MDDAEVTSTCKLTENDDGILVLDHGLDKCGTIMEYKRETEQIVFTVSNVVNFQGNSPSIVVTFQVFKNQLTIPSTIFGNSIITSAPISWNFQCNYSTNIDISSDEISMDGSPTTGDFSAYGQFDIEMRTVTQS